MQNPIKRVYQFNKEAGLLEKGYSDERECAFPIEEALEGFNTLEYLGSLVEDGGPFLDGEGTIDSPKDISRGIIAQAYSPDLSGASDLTDVDRLDKHLDIIVFSLGSIFKLGLTPQETMSALSIVAEANMQKLSVGIDSAGKQKKPEGFVGPEEQLQKILDKRSV